jgi:hypothetical protein
MNTELNIWWKSYIKWLKSYILKNQEEYKNYFFENREKIRENTVFGEFKINSIDDLLDYKILFQWIQNTNGSFLFSDFYNDILELNIFYINKLLFLEIYVPHRKHKIYRFFNKDTLSYIWRFEIINNWTHFWNVYIDNEKLKWKGIMTSIIIDFIVKEYKTINQWTAVSEEMMFFLKKIEKLWYFTFKEKGSVLGYYHDIWLK